MGQLEEDVREMILDRYNSIAAFSRKVDLPSRTIYSALRKGLANTTLTTIVPICEELGIEPLEIVQGRLTCSPDTPKPVFVPLYGSISAGPPDETVPVDDLFPIPAGLHAAHERAFMLRIKGNSMNKVFPNGYLVLVDPQEIDVISGRIYAVSIGKDEATVKRVRLLDNGLSLDPDSDDPTIRPILLDYGIKGTPKASVIGRVVWCCSPVLDQNDGVFV